MPFSAAAHLLLSFGFVWLIMLAASLHRIALAALLLPFVSFKTCPVRFVQPQKKNE